MADVNCQPLCSICHQIYIKPAALPCGHTFCVSCLEVWFRRRRVCPHCTRKVPVRFKPIGLCGWDDVLESLARQLPDEEQHERLLSKRLRNEEDGKSKPAKRRRTGTNWNNWNTVVDIEEGNSTYQTLDDHIGYPAGLEDSAADDWEEDWIDGEEEIVEEEEPEEEEAAGEEVVEEDDYEDIWTQEVEDENGDYFEDASNNPVMASVSVASNPMANISQYMNANNNLLSTYGGNVFHSILSDSQVILQSLIDQAENLESDDEDDDDDGDAL